MRLCHNSKIDFLSPFFGGVGPLKMRNNSLQVKIEGLIFSPNNYDTASVRVAVDL